MRDWICGIDVGEVCLAITFMEASTRIARKMYLINLTIQDGDKLELGPASYGRVVYCWMKRLAEWFENTRKVGIELQPQFVGRATMHIIQAHLESSIRGLYPHIEVVLVDPKRVRKFLCTSGGEYKTRKAKSVNAPVISGVDRERMLKFFRKPQYSKKTKKWNTKPKIDDVIESAQLALYVHEHETEDPIPIKVAFQNTTEPSAHLMETVQLRVPPAAVAAAAAAAAGTPRKGKTRKRAAGSGTTRNKRAKHAAAHDNDDDWVYFVAGDSGRSDDELEGAKGGA